MTENAVEPTPMIAVHLSAALGALATGPIALWARQGRTPRPALHRGFGYAWVTLITAAALSALFIPATVGPTLAGFGLIHLLVPVTLGGLVRSFVKLARGDIAGHRRTMQALYFGACVVAGAFTLLPGRYLGDLLWTGALARAVAGTPLWAWALLLAALAAAATAGRSLPGRLLQRDPW